MWSLHFGSIERLAFPAISASVHSVTMNYDLWHGPSHDNDSLETTSKQSGSEVISFKRYYPNTRTHTPD